MSATSGMAARAGRSKQHASEGADAALNDTHLPPMPTKLAMVQSLQGAVGSGVYIVEQERASNEPHGSRARKSMNPLFEQVTLVVYGWKNVEPGTLSWVFPSVSAAVGAARAMTNAVRWAIVAGKRETSTGATGDGADEARAQSDAKRALDEARARGAVLIEQAG
jgi:hypothetical protein